MVQKLLERTAPVLKESARTSLEKTIHLLQRFHIPLDILAEALIDYTAEFCVKTGYTKAIATFEKAIGEAIVENNKPKAG